MTMYDYDPRLADELRTLADGSPVPPAPTGAVLERGRRVRRRRVLVAAASGAALTLTVGALGVVAVTGGTGGPPTPPAATGAAAATGPAAGPDAGRLRLAAVLQATGGASYTQTIGITVEGYDKLSVTDRAFVGSLQGLTLTGPFDPASVTGSLKSPDGGEQRLVGGDLYVGDGRGAWKKIPGKQSGFSIAGLVSDRVALTTDPTRFLDTLRGLGTVEQSGDRFRFAGSVRGYEISGEVTVSGDRVVRLSYRVPAWPPGAGAPAVVALVTVDLSNHGEPVTVERPARVVD